MPRRSTNRLDTLIDRGSLIGDRCLMTLNGAGSSASFKPVGESAEGALFCNWGCCARAIDGREAALPRPVMNSRRRILSPWILANERRAPSFRRCRPLSSGGGS
jgi:hypothetical protein